MQFNATASSWLKLGDFAHFVFGGRRTKTMLRVMKLTAIFLLGAALTVSATTISQTVTLKAKNITPGRIFEEIKRQTGFFTVYSLDDIEQVSPISLNVRNEPLNNVLSYIFRNTSLTYEIQGNIISIKKKINNGKNEFPSLFKEVPPVTGIVRDTDGNPVVGANVTVKGTNRGTITGASGAFTLDVNPGEVLIISSVGFGEKQIKITATLSNSLELVLEKRVSELDEIQYIAYGQTTKRYSTGNTGTIKAKDIEKQPVSNPLLALQGRVPGLEITQSSGMPGTSFKVQVRGLSSLAQGSNPLFVIDGVPFAPNNDLVNNLSSSASPKSGVGLSPFNSINPADIESIEILKDADATAIYGSRGANGVVLITTKKGSPGKTRFNFNTYHGIGRLPSFMDMLNTKQYLEMRHEAFANDGIVPDASNAPDLLAWDTTKYTDFKKLLLGGTAKLTDVQASVSGGKSNTQFLLGVGLHRETTILPGDLSDRRASVNVSISHSTDDKRFSLNFQAIYSNDKNKLIVTDLTNYLKLPPNLPDLFDSYGKLNWAGNGVNFDNPLAYLKCDYTALTDNLLANLQLNYKILPGLILKASAGYNTFQNNEESLYPISAQNPVYNPQGFSQFANGKYKNWILEPQLVYNESIKKSTLQILIGGTWQRNDNNSNSISAFGYSSDALLRTISAATNFYINNTTNIYSYNAGFGRISYNLENKYLLTLAGRRDGSSRFGPNRRFANFGSVGAAWIFSNTAFFKREIPVVSFAKLRASYGSAGNDQVGNYQFFDTWMSWPDPYQGNSALLPTRLFNADYGWEVNKKLETALEIGLLDERLLFSLSYYRNRSSNQLINYSLPSQTGFSFVLRNFPAVVQNSGLEISLSTNIIKRRNFDWTVAMNLTVPKNKLVSFPGIKSSTYAYTYVVGKPLSIIYSYQFNGLNSTSGIFDFADINKDNAIDINDYAPSLHLAPDYYGGINNSFKIFNFQVDAFFDFKKQNGLNILNDIYGYSPPGFMLNQPTIVLDRWQVPGDKSNIQRFTSNSSSGAANASSFMSATNGIYGNASFFRFKTLSISYALKPKLLEKWHMVACRLYVQGQNLFTSTQYEGSSPETQNFYIMPPLRVITAGLQLTF